MFYMSVDKVPELERFSRLARVSAWIELEHGLSMEEQMALCIGPLVQKPRDVGSQLYIAVSRLDAARVSAE